MAYGRWTLLIGILAVLFGVPAWGALLGGIALASFSGRTPSPAIKPWTTRALQAGVVALGAGMELPRVLETGTTGLGLTAASLAFTLTLAYGLGRWLSVGRDTSLLLGVGTAICGGSAIAAAASVIKPRPHELSVSLAVVFVLNALALLLFPPLGHALGLSQEAFGRWAAVAIHDTSSVVGAGLAYGEQALDVATTTKLARSLWIVPVTAVIALVRARRSGESPGSVKWPWFILGFLAVSALFSALPGLEPLRTPLVTIGRRLLVLAIFFVGLGMSREALREVGWRPLAQGVLTWLGIGIASALWLR